MNFRSQKLDDIYYLNSQPTALHRLFYAAGLVITLILVGTFGYIFLEQWGFLDSLYMTVITLATVGFKEVHILSDSGRIFTIFLVIGAISIGGYAIGTIAAFLTEGQLFKLLRGRKMAKKSPILRNISLSAALVKLEGKFVATSIRPARPLLLLM
ncbi:MAG: potassium channel family protein [candidate division KSB1 bacterium]|nr:potassium channel family protein [candidate division KSB1 bacterium]